MRETAKRLPGSLAAKATAFILVVVLLSITVGSVLGAVLMWDEALYTQSKENYKQEALEGLAYSYERDLGEMIVSGNIDDAIHYCDRYGLLGASVSAGSIRTADGETTAVMTEVWSYGTTKAQASRAFSHTFIPEEFGTAPADAPDAYEVLVVASDELLASGHFTLANTLIDWAYALRYPIYAIGAIALLLAVICFVFLMCSAGHRNGHEEVMTSFVTRMPLDLLTGILAAGGFLALELTVESTWWADDWVVVLFMALFAVTATTVVIGYCYDFAVRVKLGHWWRNTVIYWLLRLLWRGAKAVGHGIATLFRNLPLIWKTALVLLVLTLGEFCGIVAFGWDTGVLAFCWFLEKLVVVPAVLYFALVLRKLEKGGQALAAGDLSYQVNTRKMVWNFKWHGENLNSIAGGMAAAVEERLKSERLKTELITNVSHDIKTPLTSIINYADLIEKEPTDNEKITEYADVLHRQGQRLKKLIEDLVEASKASTGNLEVLLAPCELGVLAVQTAGEYEQRLAAGNLTLVTKQPEVPVKILADGRRLWRVFENLMNNVCKYAQSGTRVYLSVGEEGTDAVISLKNTSREPLNLTAEEFMERFVRGDSSRSTEGSGLGLSIAKSMTELQGGKFELTVDGDLFKVELRFKKI